MIHSTDNLLIVIVRRKSCRLSRLSNRLSPSSNPSPTPTPYSASPICLRHPPSLCVISLMSSLSLLPHLPRSPSPCTTLPRSRPARGTCSSANSGTSSSACSFPLSSPSQRSSSASCTWTSCPRRTLGACGSNARCGQAMRRGRNGPYSSLRRP